MAPRSTIAFLSGTRRDFRPHPFFDLAKTRIEESLGYEVRMMEDAEPEDIPPDHWSRREAASPDVLIGLIGNFYGATTKSTGRSLTEEEYGAAEAMGVDRLMFLTDSGDATLIEGQDQTAKEKIQAFRQRIDEDVVRKDIENTEEFAKHVVEALRRWEERTFRGALVKAKVHFSTLLDQNRLYSLRTPLIGQTTTLDELEKFLASDRRIFVLEAPWGRGKSRMLLEVADRHPEVVRFLREGAEPERQILGLSPRDPRVIIVDDSHKRGSADLRILLDLLGRTQPCVKVIFATRPGHLRIGLESAIQSNGFEANEIDSKELPSLSDADQGQLIEHLTERSGPDIALLARRTRGNTLAAVIAARLIRRGHLNVRDLEESKDFEHEVLKRFKTEVVNAAASDPTIQRQLGRILEVVALAGPVRPGDPHQAEILASFIGQPREEFVRGIGELEGAGLLLRRGGLVRVAVDAIAESIVFEACVTEHGEQTGLVERALAELRPVFGKQVLRNLALAEWEGMRSGQPPRLLDRVWPMLLGEYQSLGGWQRLSFLNELEEIAPFQPREALNFVREVLGLGMGDQVKGFFGEMRQEQLDDALAGVLRGPLHHQQFLHEACDLLWVLAAGDQRPPNRIPYSAERILREVGEFTHDKPLWHHEAFLSWIETKARIGEIPGERLCEYVSPLLEKEARVGWADGHTFRIGSQPLIRERTESLRTRAIALLAGIVQGQEGKARFVALRALVKALNAPPGRAREVTQEEIDEWERERLETLELLETLWEQLEDRGVALILRTELWRFVSHERSGAVRTVTSRLLEKLDADLAGSLELALTPAFYLAFDVTQDSDREHEAKVISLAEQLICEEDDPDRVFADILEAHQRLLTCGLEQFSTTLLIELAKRRPAWGLNFLANIASGGENHPLAHTTSDILKGVSAGDQESGGEALESLLEGGPATAVESIAWSYRFRPMAESLGPERTLRHLKILLRHQHVGVRRGALVSVGLAKHLDPRARAELLLAYDPRTAPETAPDWAMGFLDDELYESLRPGEHDEIVAKIGSLPRLDDYHFCALISRLCLDAPETLVNMMLERIRAAKEHSEGFRPIPDPTNEKPWDNLPDRFREMALLALGELIEDQDFLVSYSAQEWFSELASGQEPLVAQVVRVWIQDDSAMSLERAAEAIGGCGKEGVFRFEEVIVEILERSARHGRQMLDRVMGKLAQGPTVEGGSRTPGEPDPAYVQVRDSSLEAARKYPEGSPTSEFFLLIVAQADERMERDARHDEEFDLR